MRNLILLLAGFGPFFLASQDAPPPMKYGIIPPEDLAMKSYPLDSSAAAVVLCDYGKVRFEGLESNPYLIYARHRRIKFLRRSGFEYGNVSIYYHASLTKVKNLRIQVLAPDGRTTEVSKNDIFEEKVGGQLRRIRFAFPNLQEGSVAEYAFELESESIFELPEWYFQGSIPVRWSELRLTIPTVLRYVSLFNGRTPDISEASDAETIGTSSSGRSRNIRLAMKDVPALREENFITTMDDYYSRIRFQLKNYRLDWEPRQVLDDWGRAATALMELESFGNQLTKKSRYKNTWEAVKPQLAAAATTEEKIDVLYRFVQTGFEFEDHTYWAARQNLDDLFEKKKASPSEANLLLVALAREAGLQADPVLTSTRDHGSMVPDYPMLDQFNHVLALVQNGEKQVLLDAGSTFRPPGMVAVHSLNHQGWKVNPTRPQWIPIEAPTASEVYYGTFQVGEEGQLKGKVQISEEGYSAMERRVAFFKEKAADKHWTNEIQHRYPDAQLDSVTVEHKDDLAQPLRETFTCTLPAYAQVSGDFIYLNPVFYSSYFENPFKLEHRAYPVDMPYPFKERVVFEVIVPPGYKVESLPEAARLTLPNNAGRFQYSVQHQGNKITMNTTIQVSQVVFQPAEYDALRSFFGMIAEKFGEQVVLKKI